MSIYSQWGFKDTFLKFALNFPPRSYSISCCRAEVSQTLPIFPEPQVSLDSLYQSRFTSVAGCASANYVIHSSCEGSRWLLPDVDISCWNCHLLLAIRRPGCHLFATDICSKDKLWRLTPSWECLKSTQKPSQAKAFSLIWWNQSHCDFVLLGRLGCGQRGGTQRRLQIGLAPQCGIWEGWVSAEGLLDE